MNKLPIRRIVLYKHGVGYFEREGNVNGDAAIAMTFKQNEVSDVLKSLTVLDLHGGHVSSVSYDSTKPLEQLLAEVALNIPDRESLVSLLPQIKGARVALHTGVTDPVEGNLLGVDTTERQTGDGVVKVVLVSIVTDNGSVRSFDLHGLASLQILDDALRRDLDFYLRTQLSATKKDARTFTFFAQGQGERDIRLSYTLEAPVWKATYRIILGDEKEKPFIQGWAVVDNTQDEDWENVQLSLISGLPVSFVHDLYTPRFVRRPEVKVKETTGVLPPELEEGYAMEFEDAAVILQEGVLAMDAPAVGGAAAPERARAMYKMAKRSAGRSEAQQRLEYRDKLQSSVATQVREQVLGDLLEYQIEHPVTIRRNQSALVPIVQRDFDGRPVLLYNKGNYAKNPMSSVLFKNTTGLTLEGGPVTVLQEGSYVGEAMLESIKPDEERIVPYAVELGVSVTDSIKTKRDKVHRVVIRNGMMKMFFAEVHTTTYTFKNKAEKEYTLYLEHPRSPKGHGGDKWELVDTPEPVETTENFWRFKSTLPAKKTSAAKVKQQIVLEQHFNLHNANMESLQLWLSQRYLDAPTEKVLREIVAKREEEAKIAGEIAQLQAERDDIFNTQKRIRENLQSLGDRPAEKELRERFVKSLNTQEDRLEEIDKSIKSANDLQNKIRQEINRLLQKLEYDAKIG